LFQHKPQDDGTGTGLVEARTSTSSLIIVEGEKRERRGEETRREETRREERAILVLRTLIQVETLYFYGPQAANIWF
jgi:hypothetical protein